MSATAIKSPSHSHSHSHSQSRSSRPSTTPRAFPFSVGQSKPPLLSPKNRSPQPPKDLKSPSPSYFGFVVGGEDSIPPDSNPGHHARQNWTFPTSAGQTTAPTPRHVPNESNPALEAFRRHSEQKDFNLNQSLSSESRPSQSRTHSAHLASARHNIESPVSPHSLKPIERSVASLDGHNAAAFQKNGDKSFFDIPRQESPGIMTPRHTIADHQHARLSLPTHELDANSLPRQTQRSETLAHVGDKTAPSLVAPAMIVELLQKSADLLILDLRVYQQFAAARVQGALNLCIPTTLLKRPSFTTQKLCDTFTSDYDRDRFDRWQECQYIVVYDANSSQAKEAVTPLNVLKKFASEGWNGTGLVIKGGFLAFSKMAPDWVDRGAVSSGKSNQPLSISPPSQDAVPVAGGCSMPSTTSAANPFFGNIRQNMDLLDGVGQMPIQKPLSMSDQCKQALPHWLREAVRSADEGKIVSGRFLSIERGEQKRMQDALTTKVSYGTPTSEGPKRIQVAGIEKGSKNRYNNIFPYEHTRVRLQGVPRGGCDYINANHVKAQYSNRHYIATQAPIPATFNDYWRVVWEQDVRVIVMLTAEAEGGQIKSHTYWNAGDYGPLKLKQLSERQISLEPKGASTGSSSGARRPSLGQRRSTTNNVSGERKSTENMPQTEASVVTLRTFTLSHAAYPFQPMREVTQLQYSQWPDFGAPASPTAILALIDQVNKYVRGSLSPSTAVSSEEAVPKGQRPIIVHCSAGCGRTGTFCTIDSVIDMLKRQRTDRLEDTMEIDEDEWVKHDDQDLVEKTVEDFRHQRLSMVQNLRQFVLCYESVLQWVVQQQHNEPDRLGTGKGKDGIRRSYQG